MWKTFERRLSVDDAETLISQKCTVVTVFTNCSDGCRTEIAATAGGADEGRKLHSGIEGGKIQSSFVSEIA